MQVFHIPINALQKEETRHGTYDFPLALYETCVQKNVLGFVHWHWHDELQFCYVTQGVVEFYLNQQIYTLSAGDGIFINSTFLHMVKDQGQTEGTYLCLDFAVKMLSSFSGSLIEQKYVRPYVGNPMLSCCVFPSALPHNKPILDGFLHLVSLLETKDFGYEIDVYTTLLSLWKMILAESKIRGIHKKSTPSVTNTRLITLLSYLDQHYAEQIELAHLATLVNLSTSECCRLFKKVMNCTIFDYLFQLKLKKSMELLMESDCSIGQIALDTGFGSSSYYIDRFHQTVGVTPNNYRTLHHNKVKDTKKNTPILA